MTISLSKFALFQGEQRHYRISLTLPDQRELIGEWYCLEKPARRRCLERIAAQ
jgi:hypothetical protein